MNQFKHITHIWMNLLWYFLWQSHNYLNLITIKLSLLSSQSIFYRFLKSNQDYIDVKMNIQFLLTQKIQMKLKAKKKKKQEKPNPSLLRKRSFWSNSIDQNVSHRTLSEWILSFLSFFFYYFISKKKFQLEKNFISAYSDN